MNFKPSKFKIAFAIAVFLVVLVLFSILNCSTLAVIPKQCAPLSENLTWSLIAAIFFYLGMSLRGSKK
ncbi:MAG: hypothetical protein Q7R70_04630 [Candidatus Diapherotrites archaeon]|nr:hypothetical protein [Candidatus Diapherotrites archaeon]